MQFQLFRVRVVRSSQGSLFPAGSAFNPSLLLADAIRQKPSTERRTGYTWHIGNVATVDANGLYFRIGRTTKATTSSYDEEQRDFVDIDTTDAPYTHVLCDAALEVCAIARNYDLAPDSESISKQLQRLLNLSRTGSFDYEFEISVISDPSSFLADLRSAHAIKRFMVTFTRPNAWDVNEVFTKPLERFSEETGASKGKVEIKGKALDPIALEDVARSAAAKGDDAEATIQKSKNAKPKKRKLKGNPVTIKEDGDVKDDEQRKAVLSDVREAYGEVRTSKPPKV